MTLNAKLVASLIFNNRIDIESAIKRLEWIFGPIQRRSALMKFDWTDYYEAEFGRDLQRVFISFVEPVQQSDMALIKKITNRIEREFSLEGRRNVNIDPGFATLSNFILTTTKGYSHRILLRDGIFGEVTLIFRDKKYRPLDWTYPDYRSEEIISFLSLVRSDI